MSLHLGVVSAPGRGHIYPLVALARRLQQKGFRVTFFAETTARPILRRAGITSKTFGSGPRSTKTTAYGPDTKSVLLGHAATVLDCAPEMFANERIQALIVDQSDLASGSIAEAMGIPFVNVSACPPVFLDEHSPPFIFSWQPSNSLDRDRRRNVRGNDCVSRILVPILERINMMRTSWKLSPFSTVNDVFSARAIITQLPKILDFARPLHPPPIFHTGPFVDIRSRPKVDFPWDRLTGKPLIFASLGTVRCEAKALFEMILDACSALGCQLVLSLGGMSLTPQDFSTVPPDAILVHYAPQLDLLKHASLCISHGGLNTALEACAAGVPQVLLPITDDQPGVASRVEWVGAGISIPVHKANRSVLRFAVLRVLNDPRFREAASRVQEGISRVDGVDTASEIIAETLSPVPSHGDARTNHREAKTGWSDLN